MKLRYTLLALVMLPSIAWAQLPDANPNAGAENDWRQFVYPEMIVNSPASIAATLSNFTEDVPPPYNTPVPGSGIPNYVDSSLVLGTNVFFVVDPATGDSLVKGTRWTPEGITADVVLALTVGGDPSEGCTLDQIGNAGDMVGKFALIARGTCPFLDKYRTAAAAGAAAILIYNPQGRRNAANTGFDDNFANMSGTFTAGDPVVPIPGAGMPYQVADPIFTALANGETVNVTVRADALDYRFPVIFPGLAGEGSPSAAGAGLFLAGPNPTSANARLQVRTPVAEQVSVAAYNMLGQRVATLFEGAVIGQQDVTLTTTNLPAGSYFIRAVGETFTQTQQITVVR